MKKTNESLTSLPARLRDGYQAFRSGRLLSEQSRYRDLAERGQAPETMVIGCCDSRGVARGDLRCGARRAIRGAQRRDLVLPYAPDGAYHGVSAALEYAVLVLRVRHIVVLGHARCGGIAAYANDAPPGDFIGKWISLLTPVAASVGSRAEAPGSYLTRLERASLLASIENLKSFLFIRAACARGTLALYGAYFDVATGELSVLKSRDPAVHGGPRRRNVFEGANHPEGAPASPERRRLGGPFAMQ